MNIKDRIIKIEDNQLSWNFEIKNPRIVIKPLSNNCCAEYIDFDPFPCYHHNLDLVEKCVEKTESLFPIGFPPRYFIFPFECLSRTNGHALKSYVYGDDYKKDGKEFEANISLFGKRIPIHPAMTRYLVSHEYGHVVDYWITTKTGCKDEVVTDFDREYAKVREIEICTDYGARGWHKNIGEIIANDFRICICQSEEDFWPHEELHPNEFPKIKDYWMTLKKEFSV